MSNWALIWGDKALIASESIQQGVFSKHYTIGIYFNRLFNFYFKWKLKQHYVYKCPCFFPLIKPLALLIRVEFMHGKSAISSQNNPLVSVLPYPDIVWNARSRKFKKQEIQTMVACKMSNIFCPPGTTLKNLYYGNATFFFRRETKSSVNDFIVELHGFPPLFVLLLQL